MNNPLRLDEQKPEQLNKKKKDIIVVLFCPFNAV
jgi:hypothetical protein